MAEPGRQSSVQFNLAELMRIEEARVHDERRCRAEARRHVEAERLARKRAEREREARQAAAVEQRAQAEQRQRAQLALEREAALLRVRTQHELAVREAEAARANEHELALARLEAGSRARRLRGLLWAGSGLAVALSLALGYSLVARTRLHDVTASLVDVRDRLRQEQVGIDALRAELATLQARRFSERSPAQVSGQGGEARAGSSKTPAVVHRPERGQRPRATAKTRPERPARALRDDPLADLGDDSDDPLVGLARSRGR